jgi:hypothetical protein
MADRLGRLGLSKQRGEGERGVESAEVSDSAEHSTVAALGDVHDRSSQSSLKMEKLMVALSRTQAGRAADLSKLKEQDATLVAQREEIAALRARVGELGGSSTMDE